MSSDASEPSAVLPSATEPPAPGRIERALVDVNRWALVVLMAAMAVLVIANVFGRYVFDHSIVWAEELSRYMMVWVGFVGAGLVLRAGAHIAVEVFQDVLPRRAAQSVRVVVVALLAATFVAMAWLGSTYVYFAWGQETPVLNWNFGLVYLAVPLGAVLLLVHLAFIAREYVRDRRFDASLGLSGGDVAS